MKYSDIYEYFWVVLGYQGGVGFIKIFVGCFYYDYYGENLFCIDMGIEWIFFGFLFDYIGVFGESEKYVVCVFGVDCFWLVVVGIFGFNCIIM